MSVYSLIKQIESCHVTKELIEQIEDYLFKQLPTVVKFSTNNIRKNYALSIRDNMGKDVVSSISKYGVSIFSDTTDLIFLEVRIKRPRKLTLSINFAKNKEYSEIRITHKHEEPRTIVLGIYEAIKRIIKQQANKNRIFNPSEPISVFYGVLIGLIVGVIIFLFTIKLFNFGIFGIIIFLFLVYFSILGKFLYPYISFELNRYLRIKNWSSWFFWGFLSFIIFGTILALLRKKIFGI